MSKPRLFPLTLGLSVCFHAVLLLFFSVKASISLASPVQAEREEAFSLVNIALTESAPPPRRAAPEAPSPPTAKPVQVSEDEPAEHYIEQDIEQVEESIASETEDKVDPAPVTEESAGYAGAPESAVVAAGGTAEKSSQSAEYIKRNYRYIQRRIRDKLVYPAPARKAGIQGVTELSFTIHEDGRVSAVRVLKSSGHVVLDEAAVETIYAAAPFPKPPASARIAIPIAFRLR